MKPKIISTLFVFLLSISIIACSNNKSSLNLNYSSSPSSNMISNTSILPSPSSSPMNTPSDSKAEDIKTKVSPESKIYTVSTEKIYDILSTKTNDVINSLGLSDSDNIKSINEERFYVPVFHCDKLGILIGFNGANFDSIDKVKKQNESPIFIMPNNGTIISFEKNINFRVGDDMKQFKTYFGEGDPGKEGNLKGDKQYCFLTYAISNLRIRFTSLDGDDFKKYSVNISKLQYSPTSNPANNGIRQTPTPSIAPMPTLQPIVTSTAPTQTTPPILCENTSHGNGLFAPIIDAYAALERSGYTSFDKDIIGDSLLAESKGSTYNFGWDAKPTLMYAFYDINGDGSPELLIGAEESISGIYVLQNVTPVSVLQVESRHNLYLLMDSDGNCVIEDSSGHMGYATDFFYKINENGKLVTLNKLYTNGDDKKGGKFIGHFRAKDVQGKEVSITEEEYCSLMRKYGSTGYEPLEDTGKARMIVVMWKPVDTYNKHLNVTP